jgi:pilus assembly protein Flp/PilA
MKKVNQLLVKFQIWKNSKGQDLIEYALMAGFVAVAAGAIVPGVATSMKNIFNKINSILASSAGT